MITCKAVHHDIENHSHPVIEQGLPKHHVVQVTINSNFRETTKRIYLKHTRAMLVSYMARTATGSTAETMLEKVNISTGARVMLVL